MELQGDESSIYRIIPMLEKSSWIRIEDWQEQNIPVEEDESGFRVRG